MYHTIRGWPKASTANLYLLDIMFKLIYMTYVAIMSPLKTRMLEQLIVPKQLGIFIFEYK